jgi:hypothetical protein
MKEIINGFPREIAFPKRRIVFNEKTFYELINKNNKLKNVYYSLYVCDNNHNFENTLIDKIVFDFDGADLSLVLNEVIKLSDYCVKKSFKHLIVFSGMKGFHVYVLCAGGENLQFKKDAVFNAQNFFKNELNIHPDTQLFGDIKRIFRMPNTWHVKGERYCIPLTRNDLFKGIDFIKIKSLKQNFRFVYYGNVLLNICEFDNERPSVSVKMPKFDYDIVDVDALIKDFVPCMKRILLNIDECGTWSNRFEFCKYCKDKGLPKQECFRLCKKYFGKVARTDGFKNNFEHLLSVKGIDYAYNNGGFVKNCKSLFVSKACVGKCKKYCSNGFYLYK